MCLLKRVSVEQRLEERRFGYYLHYHSVQYTISNIPLWRSTQTQGLKVKGPLKRLKISSRQKESLKFDSVPEKIIYSFDYNSDD